MVGLYNQQVTTTGGATANITYSATSTGTGIGSIPMNVVFVEPIPVANIGENVFLQYVNQWFGTTNGATVSGSDLPSPEVLARARRLLEGILPYDELVRWDRDHYVEVKSRLHPGRTYRIGLHGGAFFYREPLIDVYVNGVKYAKVCLHVDGLAGVLEDYLTAKFLICAYAEDEVDEVGNWTYLDGSEYTRDRAQDFVMT